MDKSVELVSLSVNNFAKDLYKVISGSAEGNVFFSPFSIATALSMLYMGSKGNTEQQIKTGMHLPEDKELIKNAFHKLISDYKREDVEYVLRTSNMAYVHEKYELIEEFLDCLKKSFLSTIENVDFAESEKVRKQINDAVEKETNSKIKDLIPSGTLDSLTRLVLVNAIYFKGNWVDKFDENNTKPKPFWVTATESVNVPMMFQEKNYRLNRNLRNLNASLLAMDYEGSRLSFVILLPNERDGLKDLENNLDSVDLVSLDNVPATEVKIYIPKFKLEESIDLNSVLQTMGMTDMFSDRTCDLSGLSSEPGLYVSKVLHKAFIEVNEEGSEAAAATCISFDLECYSHIPTAEFVIDHPFVFFIKDNNTKEVLFIGRCVKPNEG